MTHIIKQNIHTVIAESILADIQTERSAYYYFIGGTDYTGASFPEQNTTYAYERWVRNEMVALKRILNADVSFVVPRVNWASGVVYDHFADYSDDFPAVSGATKIEDAKFYVLNDEFRVYKCLWNNNGAPSTIKPSGTLTTSFETADGYRWKYLYAIPLSFRTKFLTENLMPVQTAATAGVDSSQLNTELLAEAGTLDAYRVINPGSGYTTVTVTIDGDGVGATAHAVISSGRVVAVVCDTPGRGYTKATVTITGNGSGAMVSAEYAPKGGHGKNAIYELYATRLAFQSNMMGEKNHGFDVTNDFRNIGIIRNIKSYGVDKDYTSLQASACWIIKFIGTKPNNDDMLTAPNGKRFRVVQTGSGQCLVQNLDNYNVPGNTVLLNSAGGAITVTGSTPPHINKFTGELLVVDNFSVDQVANGQIVVFKTTIKF